MAERGEKRRFLRIGRNVPIEVNRLSYPVDESLARTGEGRDVSGGGMRFWVPVPYEPRARLTLKIAIPDFAGYRDGGLDGDDAPAALSAVAEVVWCRMAEKGEGFDVGIRFVDIAAADYRALKRFLGKPESGS